MRNTAPIATAANNLDFMSPVRFYCRCMLPSPNEVQTTPFNTALARGLAATGQLSEAIALIEHTIRQVDRNGDFCYMPELLRVKGGLLLSMPDPGTGEE